MLPAGQEEEGYRETQFNEQIDDKLFTVLDILSLLLKCQIVSQVHTVLEN